MTKVYRWFFLVIIGLSITIGCEKQKNTAPLSSTTNTPVLDQTQLFGDVPTKSIAPVETQRPESQTELQPGSEEPDVLWLENQLFSLGYWEVGIVEGKFDIQTEAALKHFQLCNNLEISGIVDPDTRAVLEGDQAVSYYIPPPFPGQVASVNATAPFFDDHALQDRLASLGYIEPGSFAEWTSGAFGPKTRDALVAFQKDSGVTQNGIPDLKTWQNLFSPIPQWVRSGVGESVKTWQTSLYAVGSNAVAMAWDGSRLWMAFSRGTSYYDNYLLRIDPTAHPAEAVISIRPRDYRAQNAEIANMIFADGRLWVLYPNDEEGNPTPLLQMIDPETGIVYPPFNFADCPDGFCFWASGMGAANGLLWVAAGDQVYAVDTSSTKTIGSQTVGFLANGKMVFDGQCFWYMGESSVGAFSPKSSPCRSRNATQNLFTNFPETDGALVWTISNNDGVLSQLNLDTGVTIQLAPFINSPTAMVYANNLLWVADAVSRSVVGYSPSLGNSGRKIVLQGDDQALMLQESDFLWVYNRASGSVERVNISDYTITPVERTATAVFTATPSPTITPHPTVIPTATMPALARTLKLATPNMQGEDVRLLQERLLELGYTDLGVADGFFGKLTDKAVRQFQQENGLTVDGIVGPATWQTLFRKP